MYNSYNICNIFYIVCISILVISLIFLIFSIFKICTILTKCAIYSIYFIFSILCIFKICMYTMWNFCNIFYILHIWNSCNIFNICNNFNIFMMVVLQPWLFFKPSKWTKGLKFYCTWVLQWWWRYNWYNNVILMSMRSRLCTLCVAQSTYIEICTIAHIGNDPARKLNSTVTNPPPLSPLLHAF